MTQRRDTGRGQRTTAPRSIGGVLGQCFQRFIVLRQREHCKHCVSDKRVLMLQNFCGVSVAFCPCIGPNTQGEDCWLAAGGEHGPGDRK